MDKCVYAGSFDPVTNGHLWMIEKGTKLFNEFVVAIGISPKKKYTFSLDDRLDMLKKSVRDFSNVQIASFENQFLVNYAKSIGADFILRGIRNEGDYEYERGMRHVNSDLNPQVTTAFLMPPREIAEVSSSLVKGLVGPEGWEDVVESCLPKNVYNKFLVKFKGLQAKWNDLYKRINAKGNPETAYTELLSLYGKNQRAYHNLVHIAHAIREFNDAKHLMNNPEAVETALWYHDAIYNTHAKDNEEKSAQLAAKRLSEASLTDSFAGNVNKLILATKHKEMPKEKDAQYVVDIDLAALGKPEKKFDEDDKDIKEEYGWVSEEQFKQGRSAMLKNFLKRPSIYLTDFFKEKYEAKARKNLERALEKYKA
ncbi:pantetheine-phosphate adenylyltransferase [Candidatus Pacearchaeota archaeon]|nr:pantetheine-phosphate adenylyltransferase [Candidatus Pacearchaeota archaeon]